jgi:hypothetical protein
VSDTPTWSEDHCTCGCPVSAHEDDGRGRCSSCDAGRHYARGGPSTGRTQLCTRYQWNGEPRRRTW